MSDSPDQKSSQSHTWPAKTRPEPAPAAAAPLSGKPDNPTPAPEAPPAPRRTRRMLRLFALFLLLILLGAGAAGFEAYRFLSSPAEQPGRNIVLEISPGESFDKVARRLHQAGAVSSVFKFKLLARVRGETGNVQAGVFEFSTAWTPVQVLDQVVYGKPSLARLTIREGLPWWEVAAAVEKQGFARAKDFQEIIHDRSFLDQMGIPFANAEGFLYPDTYFLKRPPEELTPKEARQVAARMIETFWQRGTKLWGDKRPGREDLFYLVTLASLVEKETGVPEERAKVAGVYANRLGANMLLQCDPTIIYGLGKAWDGRLRRRHLEDAGNAYNTYQHPGLPPGPICSPGLAALEAAAHPGAHKFYYFVATGKPDGTHYFNTDLAGHNRDVKKYLAELKRRKAESKAEKQKAAGAQEKTPPAPEKNTAPATAANQGSSAQTTLSAQPKDAGLANATVPSGSVSGNQGENQGPQTQQKEPAPTGQ